MEQILLYIINFILIMKDGEKMSIKILLVEDQKLMRIGIKSLFCDYPEMDVIAEAENGKDAIEKCKLNK